MGGENRGVVPHYSYCIEKPNRNIIMKFNIGVIILLGGITAAAAASADGKRPPLRRSRKLFDDGTANLKDDGHNYAADSGKVSKVLMCLCGVNFMNTILTSASFCVSSNINCTGDNRRGCRRPSFHAHAGRRGGSKQQGRQEQWRQIEQD